MLYARASCAALFLFTAASASAVDIQLVFDDPQGVGFNATTPVAPIDGNAGTTLGVQRRNALIAAAQEWSSRLGDRSNPAPALRIKVRFASAGQLPCSIPGTGGPQSWIANFPVASGVPPIFTNTLYPIALAEHLRGQNLQGSTNDAEIDISFNPLLDSNACASVAGFHYGLATNTAPAGRVSFKTVALREIARGLGFSTRLCLLASGCGNKDEFWPAGGYPNTIKGGPIIDIWAHFLGNAQSGPTWANLTDAQRFQAASSDNLVWRGNLVTQALPFFGVSGNALAGGRLKMHAPTLLDISNSVRHFTAQGSAALLMRPNAISYDRTDLDLTPSLLEDLGWKLRVSSNVSLNAPSNALVGQSYQVNVQLSAANGSPSGAVTISDGQGGTCTVTNANPTGACSLATARAGSQTLTATYNGNADFSPSSASRTIQINPAPTTVSFQGASGPVNIGVPTPLSASVSPTPPAGGTPLGIIRLTNTTAGGSCDIILPNSSCSLTFSNVGQQIIEVRYLGSMDHQTSVTSGSITIALLSAVQNFRGERCWIGSGLFVGDAVSGATSYQIEDIGRSACWPSCAPGFSGNPTATGLNEPRHPGTLDIYEFPDVLARMRACAGQSCGPWSGVAELSARGIICTPPPPG